MTSEKKWLWNCKQGWARASVDLPLYDGSVKQGEQLYWKMSLIRFGYDSNDAEAWVEETVQGKDDFNEFEVEEL